MAATSTKIINDVSDDGELDKLREEYELLFNEKPHHNAKAETLRERSQISVKNWACKPRESDKGLRPLYCRSIETYGLCSRDLQSCAVQYWQQPQY